jgi:hypothetical protein
MKKLLLSIALIFNFTTQIMAQNPGPNVSWQECFGTSGNDTFHALKKLKDGNYLATLYLQNRDYFLNNDTSAGYYLAKLDQSFNVLWKHYIPMLALKIIVLPSGEIVLGGLTAHSANKGNVFPNIHGDRISQFPDVGVIKYDSTGQNVIWAYAYGSSGDEFNLYDIIPTSDNGFLLTSATRGNDGDIPNRPCFNPFYVDAFILKIDSIGQKQWVKIIEGSGGDACLGSIVQNGINEYIIPIWSTSEDCDFSGTKPFQSSLLNFRHLWIILNNQGVESKRVLDESGKLFWEQRKSWKHGNKIYSIGFNDAKIAYNPTYPLHDNYEATINVFDDSLNLIEQKLFGGKGFDLFLDHAYDANGNHIFYGITNSTDNAGDIPQLKGIDWDHWLLKTDTNFNIIWSRTIGGNWKNTTLYSRKQHEMIIDGNLIVLAAQIFPPKILPSLDVECGLFSNLQGDTSVYGSCSDAWMVAFDLTTGIEMIPTKMDTNFKLFPNPTNKFITIENSNPTGKKYKISIADQLGKVVKEVKYEDSSEYTLSVTDLEDGIYFISIQNNKKQLLNQKIVVKK